MRHVARVIILDAGDSVLLCRYSEIREETGLIVQIGEELRERRVALQIQGRRVRQLERYFLARVGSVRPSVRNSSGEDIEELRWWSLPELAASEELVYPEGLRDQLVELLNKGRDGG